MRKEALMHLSMNDIYQYVFGNRAVISHKKNTYYEQLPFENKVKDKIRVKFQTIVQGRQSLRFRKFLRKIKNKELETILFDNDTDILPPPEIMLTSEEEMVQKFHLLNDKYGYFNNNSLFIQPTFIAFSKVCQLLTIYCENNNTQNNESIYLLAYKLLVLFGPSKGKNIFSNVENFLKKHASVSNTSLSDILADELPVYDKAINLQFWQKMIMKHGKSVLSLFSISSEITRALPEGTFSLNEVQKIAAELYYPRGKEYPSLAELCHHYRVNEGDFNKCLDKLEPTQKKRDNLPDIIIGGKDINFLGYYLVKLPINDPRVYVLGHITNSCVRVGGLGEQCIVDGISSENCGFYILLKAYRAKKNASPFINDKINYKDFALVGYGYAWISKFNNLTFDSWENQRPEVDDNVIVALLKKFCDAIAQEGIIKRVTIGAGGKTPKVLSQQLTLPEVIKEGMQYPDSYSQYILYDSLKGDEELDKHKEIFLRELDSSREISLEIKLVVKELLCIDIPFKIYLNAIRELFFFPSPQLSWALIFTQPYGKENFISAVKEKGVLFLEFLLKLNKINLLTEETYLMLVENKNQGMWVISALTFLQTFKIEVTPTIFIKIIQLVKSENNLERVTELIKQAYELQILNTAIFNQIINLSENMDDVLAVECLINQLNKHKIFNAEVLAALFSHLSVSKEICAMSILLTHTKKMTKENILAAIYHCAHYANDLSLLWRKMACFHHDELIDQENFQQFLMIDEYNEQLKIENVLIILSYMNMLNKKALALVFNLAKECDTKEFSFMISIFEMLRLAFKCKEANFLYILERPQVSVVLFKKLNAANLLNNYVWDIIEPSLPHMEDIINALVAIKNNSQHHIRKDIFRDFMEYFNLRTDSVNRTQILYDWAQDYIRFKQENPFTLLDSVQGYTGPGFFPRQENSSAVFKQFIIGEPPHPPLLALLASQPINNVDRPAMVKASCLSLTGKSA